MTSALDGWLPFRAGWRDARMVVDWCHFGDHRLAEPFFYESVVKVITHPFNMAFQQRTSVEALDDLLPGLAPSGFIFHMSRCGSTLCAQALAAMDEAVVVAEAQPISAMLRAGDYGPATPIAVARWFRGMINAYARPRSPGQTRFFVKFSAMGVLDLALIRGVFPDVPWIFLYRDPIEIIASHKVLGSAEFLRDQSKSFGLAGLDPFAMPSELYLAHCLKALGDAALSVDGGSGLILDYRDLRDALVSYIPRHFGFHLGATQRIMLEGVRGRDAKQPDRAFQVDDARKKAAGVWRSRVDAIVGPTYDGLERRRAGALIDERAAIGS